MKDTDVDFLFASNTIMSKHLSEFDPNEFDYICLDECHQVVFYVTYNKYFYLNL